MFGRGFLWWKTQSWKGKVFLFLSPSFCQSLSRASPSGAGRESEGGEKRGSRDRLRRRIVAKRLLSCALVAAQGGEDYFSILLLLLRFVPTASLL